jgi:hypothetical protein
VPLLPFGKIQYDEGKCLMGQTMLLGRSGQDGSGQGGHVITVSRVLRYGSDCHGHSINGQ